MFGIASNIKRLLYMIMEEWRTELHSMSTPIGEVKITRGIFQGDALSPLIFVIALIPLSMLLRKARDGFDLSGEKINHLMYKDDLKLYAKSDRGLESLVNTVRVFGQDVGMDFGVTKCAKLVDKRGKFSDANAIQLPDGREIKNLERGESYKYLGVLEAVEVQRDKMKKMLKKCTSGGSESCYSLK